MNRKILMKSIGEENIYLYIQHVGNIVLGIVVKTFTRVNGVTIKKTVLFIVTDLRISKTTFVKFVKKTLCLSISVCVLDQVLYPEYPSSFGYIIKLSILLKCR